MTRRIGMVLGCALLLGGPEMAGDMTSGLQMQGGENALSSFYLNRVENEKDDVLRLRLDLKDARSLKGYGLVLHFDPAQYEFVEARQTADNMLDTGNGPPQLFLAVNNTPGQVALGAMKVDGGAASGQGGLVELTFRPLGTPSNSDFRMTDGVLVDPSHGLDAVHHLEVGDLAHKPSAFELGQNVPNPFNPATNIQYQVPTSGQVKLAVYNLLGQEVQTLVHDFRDAGQYTAVWNGKDNLGRQVASGVYIYRFEADGFSQTRRMMLLK